jgi:hypothetical protein
MRSFLLSFAGTFVTGVLGGLLARHIARFEPKTKEKNFLSDEILKM